MINTGCTTAELGDFEESVQETLSALQQQNIAKRLWARDASLWKNDAATQEKIKNRLGWLVLEDMPKQIEELQTFATSIVEAGFKDVFLLGMGGSSLCPEVLKQTFSSAPGYPRLTVLDTTDPKTIKDAEDACELKTTLFILASKSGSTIEMLSLYRYFSDRLQAIGRPDIGSQFIAITDSGSPLEKIAVEKKFRRFFTTPSDVGGRYSALTYFGLLPAALLGIDLTALRKSAQNMMRACSADQPLEQNPAILLGVILGKLCEAGRNKLTFMTSASLSHFGIWAEQLIAESTGKEGKGIVPIDNECLGDPVVYGEDRLFVYLRSQSDDCHQLDQVFSAFQKAGHPVVQIDLKNRSDLAGEFFRWEMATAITGVILNINPFDEPNVSESKENTMAVLTQFEKTGQLALPPAQSYEEEISISGDIGAGTQSSLSQTLDIFLKHAHENSYVALMAYFAPSKKYAVCLQTLRTKIRDKYRVATTLGYGPRFLHSTGQLHKGGKRNGLFIQLTMDEKVDFPIPEASYSFGILKRAQALGDFHSLVRHKLQVLDIRLGKDFEKGLEKVIQSL
ncbi:MAG: glucose-6-phosphate isomerase [Nitrospirota bacterium]|nr:glucose-6-phosphate isomerase [Nitrospirota bacterium]